MNKAISFINAIPVVSGAYDPERVAAVMEFIFTNELYVENSVFALNDRDREDPWNRLALAFAFPAKDEGRKDQCRRLAFIAMITHYRLKHHDCTYDKELEEVVKQAKAMEPSYPDIAKYLTVEEAGTDSYWDE